MARLVAAAQVARAAPQERAEQVAAPPLVRSWTAPADPNSRGRSSTFPSIVTFDECLNVRASRRRGH